MINRILSLFKRKATPPLAKLTEEEAEKWHDEKSSLMELILGKEHDMVMHAIIPYAVGGGLDLYYYPNAIDGVAIATKELSEAPNEGSKNDVFDVYELAMFTRHKLDLDDAKDENTDFGKAHSNINSILNVLALYSAQANLNPRETCEFPAEMEGVGGKCFILDAYNEQKASSNFGVMAVIEVFRSEMDYARENSGETLIELLKEAGHYPYSDLSREPVA